LGDRLINDFHVIFGPDLEWREGDDVAALARKAATARGAAAAQGIESAPAAPRIYLCCGTEDPFLADNRRFATELAGLGLDARFEEMPGGHDFAFFDASLKRALEALLTPIGEARQGP